MAATSRRHSLSVLALASVLGLTVTACSSDADTDAEPSDTVTVTTEPTDNEPSESDAGTPDPSQSPSDDTSGSDDAAESPATETFTSQGGTFSFEVPEGWTAETVGYDASSNQYNGVARESIEISSPMGDITVNAILHAGAIDTDGWRAQHWRTVHVEELDLPSRDSAEHVYLRTDVQWLGANDHDHNVEDMGWETGEYRTVSEIVSSPEAPETGDSDPASQPGWAYFAPLSGNYEGETTLISVIFTQELMEYLTGKSGREDTVAAFLEDDWYQTTTDILRSIEYDEPAEEDLPLPG